MDWYALQTMVSHEDKVKRTLLDIARENRDLDRVEVPVEEIAELKDGKRVVRTRRLMPGYVIVRARLTPDLRTRLTNTPSVYGFVGDPGPERTPAPLGRAEVDRLLGERPKRSERRVNVNVGDLVRITSGPLAEFQGEVAEVDPDSGKLRVMVSIFGRETPAELMLEQIKTIDA